MADPADRLTALRIDAVKLHTALSRRLDGIIESSAHTTNDDEHDPEGVTVAFERAQVADLLERTRAELHTLDAARERLATGTYGTCLRCGHPITAERLDALPATTTCIQCANRR